MNSSTKIVLSVVAALFLIAITAMILAVMAEPRTIESMITLAATATGALGSILTNIFRAHSDA